MKDYYEWFIVSAILNVVVLLILLSPNLIYWFHKDHFKWRNKDKSKEI